VPRIDPYVNPEMPSGSIGAEASPSDFGAQIGSAMQNVGSSINQIGNEVYRVQDEQGRLQAAIDVEHVKFQAQKWYDDQKAKLDPINDPDYANKLDGLQDQFTSFLQDTHQQYMDKSPSKLYSRVFNSHMATLTWSMSNSVRQDIAQSSGAALSAKATELGRVGLASIQSDTSPENLDRVVKEYEQSVGGISVPGFGDQHKIAMVEQFRNQAANTYYQSYAAKYPEATLGQMGLHGYALPPMKIATTAPVVTKASGGQGFSAPLVPTTVAPYASLASNAGSKYGVDSNFLLAQISAESKGNPNAVSPKGATGVSQFMPKTAAQYGVDPNNAASSIEGQAKYMSDLLKQFDGDYTKAAAAYNWGQGNLSGAIQRYGDKWLQHAPTETQLYVSKIFSTLGGAPTTALSAPIADGQAAPESAPDASSGAEQAVEPQEPTDGSYLAATSDKMGPMWDMLTPQERVAIGRIAEQGVRANQLSVQQAYAMQLRAQKAQQEQANQGYLNKLIDGSLTVGDIRGDKVLTAQEREHWYNAIQTQNNKEDKTNPGVFSDAYRRIFAPAGDPNKITDPVQLYSLLGNGIAPRDVQWLVGQMAPKDKELADAQNKFYELGKSWLSKSSLLKGPDPEGENKLYQWWNTVQSQIKAEQAKPNGNPMELLDPYNRRYLGSTIQSFMRSTQQQTQDLIGRMNGASPSAAAIPRLPNETPEQYIARKNSTATTQPTRVERLLKGLR
jgi:hypothetical protein